MKKNNSRSFLKMQSLHFYTLLICGSYFFNLLYLFICSSSEKFLYFIHAYNMKNVLSIRCACRGRGFEQV